MISGDFKNRSDVKIAAPNIKENEVAAGLGTDDSGTEKDVPHGCIPTRESRSEWKYESQFKMQLIGMIFLSLGIMRLARFIFKTAEADEVRINSYGLANAGLIAVVLNLFISAPKVTSFLGAFCLGSFSGALALMLLARDKTPDQM